MVLEPPPRKEMDSVVNRVKKGAAFKGADTKHPGGNRRPQGGGHKPPAVGATRAP